MSLNSQQIPVSEQSCRQNNAELPQSSNSDNLHENVLLEIQPLGAFSHLCIRFIPCI